MIAAVLFSMTVASIHANGKEVKNESEDLTYESLPKEELERADKAFKEFKENWNNDIPEENLKQKGFTDEEIKKTKRTKRSVGGSTMTREARGDILITKDQKLIWRHGHAGVVYNDSYVVEALPAPDNVDYQYIGKWKWPHYDGAYETVKGMYVVDKNGNKAEQKYYTWAGSNAGSHVGKPYNKTIVNMYRTDRFYCSQLVWRAWKDSGYDVGNDSTFFVTPADIAADNNTRTWYSRSSPNLCVNSLS